MGDRGGRGDLALFLGGIVVGGAAAAGAAYAVSKHYLKSQQDPASAELRARKQSLSRCAPLPHRPSGRAAGPAGAPARPIAATSPTALARTPPQARQPRGQTHLGGGIPGAPASQGLQPAAPAGQRL
jgi:hypothetical protein